MSFRRAVQLSLLVFLLASCSPSPTLTPSPAPAVLSPEDALAAFGRGVQISSRSNFEDGEEPSDWAMNLAHLAGAGVVIRGYQDWSSYLVYLSEFNPGSGLTARFKFDQGAVLSIVLQHGEWNTADFREMGFGLLEDRWQSVLSVGESYFQADLPQRPIDLAPDTWYQAAFFVDKQGQVLAVLWTEEEPDRPGMFAWQLDEDDRGLGWRPAVQVHTGVVEVDSVAFFDFEDFQPAALPALAALQLVATAAPSATPAPTATPGPTPVPTLGPGAVAVNEADQAPLAYIPAGEFEMGVQEDLAAALHDRFSDPVDLAEYPTYYSQYLLHRVFTDAFWIYQYEVTNQQFAAFLNEKGNQKVAPYNPPKRGGAWYIGHDVDPPRTGAIFESEGIWQVEAGREDHPVVWMDWYAARAYCEWAGGRLPTESEWEKAARGGLSQAAFPWGEADPVNTPGGSEPGGVNFAPDESSRRGTSPVGSYAPNGYGLYDMAGNVFELVSDWYAAEAYSYAAVENPQGPEYWQRDVAFDLFDRRVIRGGSWFHNQFFQTTWYRGGSYPFSHEEWLGFRCVVDVE